MRTGLGIGTALLAAASLLTPAAFAQGSTARPRARSVATTGGAGYLGIGARDVDAERAKALKLPEVRGAEITNVYEDSPAAKAGFKEGDVVLEYNGQRVEGIDQLSRLVGETPAGRQAKILVSRNGSNMTLTPTLEAGKRLVIGGGTFSMPEMRIPEITIPPIPPIEIPRFQMYYQNPILGITGEALAQQEQLAEFFGVKDGVLVRSVSKDSAAEKAGLKAGDVIVKVDDSKVGTTREITSVLHSVRSKKTVTVIVVRNKKEMPITVSIEAAVGIPVRAMIGPVMIGPVVLSKPFVITKPMVIKPMVVRPNVRILQFPAQNRVI